MLKFTDLISLFVFLKSPPKWTQYSRFGSRKCQTSPDGQVPVGKCDKWKMKEGEFPDVWFHCIVDSSNLIKIFKKQQIKCKQQNNPPTEKLHRTAPKSTQNTQNTPERSKTTTKRPKRLQKCSGATWGQFLQRSHQISWYSLLQGSVSKLLYPAHICKPVWNPPPIQRWFMRSCCFRGSMAGSQDGVLQPEHCRWETFVISEVTSEITANKCKLINRTWEKTNDFMLSDKSWDILEGRHDMCLNAVIPPLLISRSSLQEISFPFLPAAERSFSVYSHPMLQRTHLKIFHHLLKIMWQKWNLQRHHDINEMSKCGCGICEAGGLVWIVIFSVFLLWTREVLPAQPCYLISFFINAANRVNMHEYRQPPRRSG